MTLADNYMVNSCMTDVKDAENAFMENGSTLYIVIRVIKLHRIKQKSMEQCHLRDGSHMRMVPKMI